MRYLAIKKAGVYRECDPGEEATAVFLEKHEYNYLTDFNDVELKIRFLENNDFDLEQEKKEIEREIKETEARIETLRAELDEKAAAMHELDDDVSKIRNNNENLLRMIKEKANQDRDLRPKKGHPGYVVTRQDEETSVVGYDGFGNPIDLRGWRTTVETPYDINIPIELIEETVIDDLSQVLRGSDGIYKGRYTDVLEAAREENVVYNYDFHANVNNKKHLWTVCLHSPHQVEIEDGKEDE